MTATRPRTVILAALLLLLGACSSETTKPEDGKSTPSRSPERSDATPSPLEDTAEQAGIEADLVLRGGDIVDGTGAPPLEDASLAIRDGRIVAVGEDLTIADGARIIDVRGGTVLPGFVNAHVHARYATAEEMRAWTGEGVTTVRDLAGYTEALVARREAATRDPRLPRLTISGPMISVPGGHPFPIYGEDYPAVAVRGAEDARATVDGLLDAGVDHVKIAVSGRADTGWPELSDVEIRAIADAAHARGARVSVHVDTASALRRAVENGVDDAAHAPRDPMPQDLIDLMVESGVALVPTIDVYENLAAQGGTLDEWNASTLPIMQDNLRRFAAAGGTLALGDDFGNPGVELGMPLDEIEQWTAAGLTPMQVIVASTRGGAVACGLEDEVGTLEEAKAADILVVEGDPLEDFSALERPVAVIHGGELLVLRGAAL